jgi:FMN-dependent NADH-azoreductase
MKRILIVDVSRGGPESASRKVARKLEERLKTAYPSAEIMLRDLVDDNLPHLDGVTLKPISTKDAAEAQNLKESATLSDKLTDELLASDILVIATPTWNFGIPSSLKAWVDLVVRPGKTFSYTNDGVLGLAKGKKAILVLASGGVFTEGRGSHGTSWSLICVKY